MASLSPCRRPRRPLELGYLSLHAKRTTGSWSPLAAIDYRAKVPWKRLALLAVGLAAWMIVLVAVAIAFLDEWPAGSMFAWLPETILAMATVGGDEGVLSTGALVALLALFFVTNGIVGPVTEELCSSTRPFTTWERVGSSRVSRSSWSVSLPFLGCGTPAVH